MAIWWTLVFRAPWWMVYAPVFLFWPYLQIFNCHAKGKLFAEVSLVIVVLVPYVHSTNFELDILENEAHILNLFFFLYQPAFEQIRLSQHLQVLKCFGFSLVCRLPSLLFTAWISLDFHFMIENIKSIRGIISRIEQIRSTLNNITILVTPEERTWSQHQVNIINNQFKRTCPER